MEQVKRELVPTTAAQLHDESFTIIETTRGAEPHVYEIRKINPIEFWEEGILTIPDRQEAEKFRTMSDEQMKKKLEKDEDLSTMMRDYYRILITRGVTSINFVAGDTVADPAKNEAHINTLAVGEMVELSVAIAQHSGFEVGDASFQDAPITQRNGSDESAQDEQQNDSLEPSDDVSLSTK